MGLTEKLRNLFRKTPEQPPEPPEKTGGDRVKKTCKMCGKTFSWDPGRGFVPNYCKDCKQKLVREKEEKQRAGAPRQIRRECRECGKIFTFPNTTARYPSYCPNCRKRHSEAQKAKYSRKKEG